PQLPTAGGVDDLRGLQADHLQGQRDGVDGVAEVGEAVELGGVAEADAGAAGEVRRGAGGGVPRPRAGAGSRRPWLPRPVGRATPGGPRAGGRGGRGGPPAPSRPRPPRGGGGGGGPPAAPATNAPQAAPNGWPPHAIMRPSTFTLERRSSGAASCRKVMPTLI